MTETQSLPLILIIDDLFGRTHQDSKNLERSSLCAQYLLEDITEDENGKDTCQKIKKPLARAVFCRGQKPVSSTVGDTVENDLDGTLQIIAQHWDSPTSGKPCWAMVLLDLCFYTGNITEESNRRVKGMPEGRPDDERPESYFGLHILRAIHNRFPDLPVVILSSKPRDQVSREFSALGALGFLDRSNPDSPAQLKEFLWRHGLLPDENGLITGYSKALLIALRAARRAARSRGNILIIGERGTGKDLFARYLHLQSEQSGHRPFEVIDSGTLKPELYNSELFGYKRGAFTGAFTDKVGRIVKAAGGDLFLDEIGNIPPNVQDGLLRALENREVVPLGGQSPQPVDVRFLSATNEDIEKRATLGKGFRMDLLDRLRQGGTIVLPPLRQRKEDIPLLAEQFIGEAESANPQALKRTIDPDALNKMLSYDWPGNVRELRNCIFNAVNSNPDVEHLVPIHIRFATTDKPILNSRVEEKSGDRNSLSVSSCDLNLEQVIQWLNHYDFNHFKSAELEGKLFWFQDVFARFIARYLKAALDATRKPLAGNLQIHPAAKVLTGTPDLTASKAADLIKRLLKPLESLDDQVLNEAYEIALRLRPRRGKQKNS